MAGSAKSSSAERKVAEVDGEDQLDQSVTLAYRDSGDPEHARTTPVLLLHGSPGSKTDFDEVVPGLEGRYRTIVPDLPGFGESTRDVADYSIRAHAHYVRQLLDHLELDRVHVVGFSMGGGVAPSTLRHWSESGQPAE
jgi:pimeloyl-ACP methyl ester carboxylesterase